MAGVAVVGAVAFSSNLLWELAHGRLYAHDISALMYLRAATVDAALVVGAVGLADRVADTAAVYWLTVAGFVAIAAVGIEVWALGFGRGSYTAGMPTVGPVGVSPLLQLPATGVISVLIARRLSR